MDFVAPLHVLHGADVGHCCCMLLLPCRGAHAAAVKARGKAERLVHSSEGIKAVGLTASMRGDTVLVSSSQKSIIVVSELTAAAAFLAFVCQLILSKGKSSKVNA